MFVSLVRRRDEQLPRFDFERGGNFFDVTERDIPDAAFDGGNVSSIQFTAKCQLFLRDALLKAKQPNVIGEGASQRRLELTDFWLGNALGHGAQNL